MTKSSNENESPEEEAPRKGIPLKWVFYVVLGYAFFQTLYLWLGTRGD